MATYDEYLNTMQTAIRPEKQVKNDSYPYADGGMGASTGYSAGVQNQPTGYIPTGSTQGGPDPRVSGAAAASGGTTNTAAGGGSYRDQLNRIYDAALEQEKARIESAYAGLTPDYELARERLHQQYLDDLNRTDVEAQKAQLNWNEAKQALGLSSGTMGQAYLARQNQTQDAMSDLRAAELAAQAQLQENYEKQKQQYALEMREAIAKNDYERAQKLYELALNGQLNGGTGSGSGSGSGGSTGKTKIQAKVGPVPAEAVETESTGSGSRGRRSGSGGGGGSETGDKDKTNAAKEYYQGLLNAAGAVAQTLEDQIAGGNQTKDEYLAKIQDAYNNGRLTIQQYNDLIRQLESVR